jgi:hypothetical protein
MKDYDLYSVEWEYEDMLPKDLSDLEYDLMFGKSELRDGVRMFPYIIEHKEAEYIRLYPTDSKCETLYFVNGESTNRDTFASYLTPSDAAKMTSGEKPECFTIKRENIIATEEFGDK